MIPRGLGARRSVITGWGICVINRRFSPLEGIRLQLKLQLTLTAMTSPSTKFSIASDPQVALGQLPTHAEGGGGS